MTTAQHKNARKLLDETATSINKLVLDLENREMEGQPVTAKEIQAIANQLQAHVEDLLAAAKSLRDGKSGR